MNTTNLEPSTKAQGSCFQGMFENACEALTQPIITSSFWVFLYISAISYISWPMITPLSPKKLVGCRGGSRYVEGFWDFSYLKIKKVWCVWFSVVGVLVSKTCHVFKRYLLHVTKCPFHVFDRCKITSTVCKMCCTNLRHFSVRVFSTCVPTFRNVRFPEFRDSEHNHAQTCCHIFLSVFRYPGVSSDTARWFLEEMARMKNLES